MSEVKASELSPGRIVPNFTLPALGGGDASVSSYKQRRNLVVLFLNLGGCENCGRLLSEFEDNYQRYVDLETEILAVLPYSLDEIEYRLGRARFPFPVLSDADGRVSQLYLGAGPGQGPAAAVFVTDRYGDLRVEMKGEDGQNLPDQSAVLDWLSLIETECPECGSSADVSW